MKQIVHLTEYVAHWHGGIEVVVIYSLHLKEEKTVQPRNSERRLFQ